ncbi:MAG TPA: hypothetical protein VIN32_00185 [Candidatus Limnocylindria bacterium]
MSDPRWAVQLDPPVLLPGRSVSVNLTYTPDRDHDGRAVRARLRCRERYRYSRTEGTGSTAHRVTRTGVEELARIEAEIAGGQRFVRGQPVSWHVSFDVPELGPATFEGDVLRCDWTLEANIDLPMGLDPRVEETVHVAQPMALLRAGVIDTGQFGLFETAPVNVDALPAQIRLKPVPVSLQSPFEGAFTVEAGVGTVQEVRLELRLVSEVTVRGGHHDEIVAWRGVLAGPRQFGGALAEHPFTAEATGEWLPSVDLPHGRARGQFHVILAQEWAPDIHYVRDVALATTTEL